MTLITLAPGMEVEMHPATGFDDLLALSVRAKMEDFLKDYEAIRGNWHYQSRFALIVACTERTHGLPFDLPMAEADGATLADAYRAWLRMPRKPFRKWFEAAEEIDEVYNAPDLTPGAAEAQGQDSPLANDGSSRSSESTST